MKTIKVDYNLQNLTQAPEAHLSDLFVLLYSIFLIEKGGATPSRYALNKLFPYIFQKLEEQGELEKTIVFNLPFYKMKGGHFNKSLCESYLRKLENADLLREKSGASYILTTQGKNLIEEFAKNERTKSVDKKFEQLVDEFVIKFLRNKNYNEVFTVLNSYSHTTLVNDRGKKVRVDDLEINDLKAISYNSKYFKKGKRSSIVPGEYLTLLAHKLREKIKVSKEAKEIVDSIFLAA